MLPWGCPSLVQLLGQERTWSWPACPGGEQKLFCGQGRSAASFPPRPCVPNLPSFPREYCRRVLRKSHSDCSAYTLSFDTSIFVIESARRRVAVEATLENQGENAYNTVLNVSFSRNLQFVSLIQKVRAPSSQAGPSCGTGKVSTLNLNSGPQLRKPPALWAAVRRRKGDSRQRHTEFYDVCAKGQSLIPIPFGRVARPTDSHVGASTFCVGTQAKT